MGYHKAKDWAYLSRLTGKPISCCKHMWYQIQREESEKKPPPDMPTIEQRIA